VTERTRRVVVWLTVPIWGPFALMLFVFYHVLSWFLEARGSDGTYRGSP